MHTCWANVLCYVQLQLLESAPTCERRAVLHSARAAVHPIGLHTTTVQSWLVQQAQQL
jgi:hypothetical protein